MRPTLLLLVFLGGGLGSAARYAVSLLTDRLLTDRLLTDRLASPPHPAAMPHGPLPGPLVTWLASWPIATLAVNLLGSFAIGVALALTTKHHWPKPLELALITGVLGGFTTFSALSRESLAMLLTGRTAAALAYIALTAALGPLAALLAHTLTNALIRPA